MILETTDDLLNLRKRAFACAIANQLNGRTEEALFDAKRCLKLLRSAQSYEDTAAGEIIVAEGRRVCLPDYLHTETALQRFRAVGINI